MLRRIVIVAMLIVLSASVQAAVQEDRTKVTAAVPVGVSAGERDFVFRNFVTFTRGEPVWEAGAPTFPGCTGAAIVAEFVSASGMIQTAHWRDEQVAQPDGSRTCDDRASRLVRATNRRNFTQTSFVDLLTRAAQGALAGFEPQQAIATGVVSQ